VKKKFVKNEISDALEEAIRYRASLGLVPYQILAQLTIDEWTRCVRLLTMKEAKKLVRLLDGNDTDQVIANALDEIV
jgi:hypothetical protein